MAVRSSTSLAATETIAALEAAGVILPEHSGRVQAFLYLSAQLERDPTAAMFREHRAHLDVLEALVPKRAIGDPDMPDDDPVDEG